MKRVFLLLIGCGLVLSLCGCGINSSARPRSDFDNVRDFVQHYEDAPFDDGVEFCNRFLRDAAGLIQKADAEENFADWERGESNSEKAAAYGKDCQIFGYDAHIDVGYELKRGYPAAISLFIESGDADTDFAIAAALCSAMFEETGGSYQCYIDGEKCRDRELKELFESADPTRSFTGIWPMSSVKWSAMVRYFPDAKDYRIVINVL